MRYSYEDLTRAENIIAENKEKLDKAFKRLRKNGLIARQNFSCCGSCGSYEIATRMEELLKDNKQALGYVFYNRQSAEALRGNGRNPADGRLYISYADGSTSKFPNNIPKSTEEIGKMLAIALTDAGLVVEWDGNPDSSVLVKMDEKVAEKIEVDSETWGE